MSSMMSMTMKQPVRPAPALEGKTQKPQWGNRKYFFLFRGVGLLKLTFKTWHTSNMKVFHRVIHLIVIRSFYLFFPVQEELRPFRFILFCWELFSCRHGYQNKHCLHGLIPLEVTVNYIFILFNWPFKEQRDLEWKKMILLVIKLTDKCHSCQRE